MKRQSDAATRMARYERGLKDVIQQAQAELELFQKYRTFPLATWDLSDKARGVDTERLWLTGYLAGRPASAAHRRQGPGAQPHAMGRAACGSARPARQTAGRSCRGGRVDCRPSVYPVW
jgi:hypothetical protein